MTRTDLLIQSLSEHILVLDGATGTYLQDLDLTADDFGGAELEGCNEQLVLTRPQLVSAMHEAYLAAGADIIETNTFGATPLVLDEYGLGHQTHAINRQAAELAQTAAAAASTAQRPRFVAGVMGPTTKAISVTGGITFEQLSEHFRQQARGLIEGGVDYLLIETAQDTRNIKAALIGCDQANAELGQQVPLAVSGTIETMGTMLAGQGVEALYTSLEHADLLYLGLNCATGPAFMTDHLRSLATLAKVPMAVVPNAGLPDENGVYLETPAMMTAVMERFLERGWVNIIGGCCGTTPEHTRAFAALVQGAAPRVAAEYQRCFVSGIDFLEITHETRPVIIGERTNSVGSRLFRRLISEEKFEEASEIARRQVRNGAQIIDVNLANPDRDEPADMHRFLEQVIRKVKVPLMIDSTDAETIAAALPYCQGKSIINSINLEDGEARFEAVVPLAKRYGAALVVGTIDEDPHQGMGVTRQRKLEIARRSYELLTEKHGFNPTDLIFDPLVFPCATGDEQYLGSARETIEGVRAIKAALPLCKTVLGISNVSFGLPPAGREVLNAVFLYHCVQAGLDMAIVNAEKLERYAAIPEAERQLANDLLFNRGADPIAAFANHFRDRKPQAAYEALTHPRPEKRLPIAVVTGSKEGLIDDLEAVRASKAPLDIINGPLMEGMFKVGRLFNDNQMIVAEVLQSAEVMKAAVSHLEQFMERHETHHQGTLLLATVKGDVHDIGKNLVDIILTNNGYHVVNLGIKVPPESLIAAWREHQPDLIGLSGLLVKSAQQMVVTAEDLRVAGVDCPILVGGAALTAGFTRKRIAPAYGGLVLYAKDAMHGLELATQLRDPKARAALAQQSAAPDVVPSDPAAQAGQAATAAPAVRSSRIRNDMPIPPVPEREQHLLHTLDLDEIWTYVNPQMLYGKHLGLRGNARRLLEQGDPQALELQAAVDRIKSRCRKGWMTARALWQFYAAESDGNRLLLFGDHTAERPLEIFDLPRQQKPDGLALPDLVLTPSEGRRDHVCLLVTTAGEGIRQQAETLKQAGEYVMSHALQALALETAEAAMEWLHARIRNMWGFPDPPTMTMTQRFQAKYRGKRYSFGYPACPQLEDQAKLWSLLQPERIGVLLTEGWMMDPEASVSALAFHHPDATYFSTLAAGTGA